MFKDYTRHEICLLGVFIFGNIIISFPRGVDARYSLLGLIISVGFAVLLSFIFSQNEISNSLTTPAVFFEKSTLKILKLPMLILFCLFCVFCLGVCLRDYVNFVDRHHLPDTPRYIISAVFVALVVFMGYARKKVLLMFGLLNFIFISIVILIMFLLSINHLDLKYIFGSLKFNFKGILNQTLTFFIHSFGQLLIFLFFIGSSARSKHRKSLFGGVIFGSLLLFVCMVNVISVLGIDIVNNFEYPYASVTGMISYGRTFSRTDGITYYIYFICSLLKGAVIVNVLKGLFANCKTAARITAVLVLSVVLYLICNLNIVQGFMHSDIANLTVLIIEIIFLLVAIIAIIKQRYATRRIR